MYANSGRGGRPSWSLTCSKKLLSRRAEPTQSCTGEYTDDSALYQCCSSPRRSVLTSATARMGEEEMRELLPGSGSGGRLSPVDGGGGANGERKGARRRASWWRPETRVFSAYYGPGPPSSLFRISLGPAQSQASFVQGLSFV